MLVLFLASASADTSLEYKVALTLPSVWTDQKNTDTVSETLFFYQIWR